MSRVTEHDLRRQRRASEQLRNNAAVKYFRSLFAGVDGMALSLAREQKESAAMAADDKSLTYGEIVHSSFLQILDFVRKTANLPSEAIFVDLGCGTGKAVVAVALSNLGFSKAWGIELLQPLATRGVRVVDQMKLDLTLTLTAGANAAVSGSTDKVAAAKPKSKAAVSVPASGEVVDYIQQLLSADGDGVLACDAVVNSVCQRFGHKSYKAFIKSFGSFKKFISKYDAVFILEENTLRLEPSCPCGDAAATGTPLEAAEEAAEALGGLGLTEEDPQPSSSSAEAGDLELNIAAYQSALNPLPCEISILQGDIFLVDWWSESDVVYCASLLFTEAMLLQLFERCLEMKPGAIFISLRPCPLSLTAGGAGRRVELLSESFYRMTWQMAAVYIYRVVLSE
jgi:hypothetical protein